MDGEFPICAPGFERPSVQTLITARIPGLPDGSNRRDELAISVRHHFGIIDVTWAAPECLEG